MAGKGGKKIAVDHALSGGTSCFFDAVAVLVSDEGAAQLVTEAAAVDWLRDAYGHLKVIAHTTESAVLLARAGIEPDGGVELTDDPRGLGRFLATAARGRIWSREPRLRSPG